jgi:hypothetical protein
MQTPTPTSGGTDSTNTPTGNGGLNAIAITAVVIASIVGVGIVVAVIIAIFCHRPLGKWLKKIITNMRRHRTEAPGDIELSDQLNDDPRMKEPEDDTKRTLVLNLWPDGDELEELLYDGNPGTIPESDKKDAHKLTALITKDNCQFFYLVRRVSREELRTANETAWELLRDFNTRSFPSKVLQKFIDVWVFDENKVVGGFPELVPGPILTVNVSLNKWRGNMKGCAQLVRSKARTNIDSPDGMFSASHTPSATESPPRFTTELEPVETTVDSPLAVVTTVEAAVMQTPEAYLPHHQPPLLHQPPTESLSHLPEKPHPQSPNQPPPPYTNPNPESNVLSDILHELKKLNVTEEKVAANMQKTADNTRDMKGTQEDTRALAEEIHEAVTEPPEDTPEAV